MRAMPRRVDERLPCGLGSNPCARSRHSLGAAILAPQCIRTIATKSLCALLYVQTLRSLALEFNRARPKGRSRGTQRVAASPASALTEMVSASLRTIDS